MNENDNKLKIEGLSPYSVIPESANIRPKTGMAYNLPEISVTPQNNPWTTPLTATDVKNKQTLISNINRAQNTAGQTGYSAIDAAMGFTNPLWGLASGIAHGGLALKDIKNNGLNWNNALNAGLGIGMLGMHLPKSNVGERFFSSLPYNTLNRLDRIGAGIVNFFRTPLNKNPLKNLITYQGKRFLASSRPLNITSQKVYNTTLKDPVGLLKSRVKNKELMWNFKGEDVIANTPIKTYSTLKDAYQLAREQGLNKIQSIFATPNHYLRLNTSAGFYYPSRKSFVQINPKYLKNLNFNSEIVKSHELAHSLWANDLHLEHLPSETFSKIFLPSKINQYLDANELAARGTQLKNWFGIADDSPITGDMLKYAAKNYVKDTGMDNNMNQFFRTIKDWDEAAKWISRNSYQKGGKIIGQFKNRN